jgi:predicted glycosyltransferase
MPAARRILFRCPGKRGLGHLVRGLNIAREIRALDPHADVRFYTRGAAAPALVGGEFRCVVEPGGDGLAAWDRLVADHRPDVVVDDTLLRDEGGALPDGVRRAYVMRKSRDERHAAIVASGLLARVDVVIVPHTEAEFGHALPAALRARSVFTGPIIRRPTTAGAERVRARYGAAGDAFLLVSTAGGGGFADTAAQLFATAAAAHRRLAGRLDGFRHVVVRGPNFTGAIDALPGMTVVDFEAEMVDLLATADLVLAEGGYNTVNELRLARTPAVFVPGERAYDDQAERVAALAARGSAAIVDGASPARAGEEIAAVACAPARLRRMRVCARRERLETGNRAAAAAILGCAA